MRGRGSRILRSTAVVMASSLGVSGVGFLKNLLAAYYFGTSGAMDAYLLALLLPDMVMYLATTGSFTFIPLFAEARATSEEGGWKAGSQMISYWLLLLVVGLGVAAVFTPELTSILAPGFAGLQRERTIDMSRILLLMSGAVAVARVMALSLYAQSKFVAGSLSETLFQVASTLYLVVFWSHGISALVWGMVFGSFVQMLVVAIGLWDVRGRLRVNLDLRAPAVRKMIKLILPVYVANSAGQLNSVVNRAFASLLPAGAISSLQYGVMLAEAPVGVIASSVTSAIFPMLSKQYAEKKDKQAQTDLVRAIIAMLVLFLPLAMGVFLLARPVVELLLQRGSFNARSTFLTSTALRIYALGLVAMALNRVMPLAYQARQNTMVPMQAGLVRILGNAVVCALLVPRIGHLGVAAASVVSEHLKLGLLFLRLRTRLFQGNGGVLLKAMPRLIVAVALMALAVSPAATLLLGDVRWGFRGVLSLTGVACLGVVCYAAALYVLCREDFVYYARRLLRELPPPLGRRAAGTAPSVAG
jgi:putative peptidoglycan lipid II flippase